MPEVYSLDELARAAYVDRPAVDALVSRGRLRLIPGTGYVAAADALIAARVLRQSALLAAQPVGTSLFGLAARGPGAMPRPGWWSLGVHLMMVALVVGLSRTVTPATSSGSTESGSTAPTHLVFLVQPGPGGGGGGGGAHAQTPPTRLQKPAPAPAERPSVPETAPPAAPTELEPLPSRPVLAPVARLASAVDQRPGVVDAVPAVEASSGPGSDRGAGSGREGGSGPGSGNGLGDGLDGGTGGHVYRPGSGIEAPRLLREVKAAYSEEARRANITGDVLMEVVIRADGSVASARVTRSLGYGLDERAAAAVKQWRFAPARRNGVAVDVAVEVAMEFNLR